MPFDLKDAVAKWEALEKTDKGVPSQAFIDASLAITNIFDELSGMGMVKSDIGGNAGKIQKNVTDASKTLEEMVDAEIAAAGGDVKKATKEGSTGLALLWLKRALALITYMLEAMVADPSAKLAACVNAGYDKGLKPYHNFVMKGTFAVAMKAAPTREAFMKKLVEGGGGSDDEVMAGLAQINAKFNVIVVGIDGYLKEKGIEK